MPPAPTTAPTTLGTIILLNGPQSAGKSSLARAIQDVFDEPYLFLGLDTFIMEICAPKMKRRPAEGGPPACYSVVDLAGTDPPETMWRLEPYGLALLAGMHRAVAALAAAGYNVAVDHCLQQPELLADCLAVWTPFRVLFVGVQCPLDILQARSYARPDRGATVKNVFRWQAHEVHRHGRYDLELDTSRCTPAEGALRVRQRLHEGSPPTAFDELRARGQA